MSSLNHDTLPKWAYIYGLYYEFLTDASGGRCGQEKSQHLFF